MRITGASLDSSQILRRGLCAWALPILRRVFGWGFVLGLCRGFGPACVLGLCRFFAEFSERHPQPRFPFTIRREWQPALTSFLESELDLAGATTSSLGRNRYERIIPRA